MSNYIYFTEAQKEQANNIDLESFLRSRGETLKRSGSEWEWKHNGAKVTIRGNEWYHQYEQTGGGAIGFVSRFYNLDYPEAVQMLIGENSTAVMPIYSSEKHNKEKKPFVLPEANSNMRRLYAYLLKTRCIDRNVVNFFTHNKMLYEDAEFHNAVFVGYDENGIARHAHKRGTYGESSYKGNIDSSDADYSFHYTGTNNTLYVFEAPIDMLSFISLHQQDWQKHSYVALCCVGDKALQHQLIANQNISHVFLCLDNDRAGQEANARIAKTLENVRVSFLLPENKDWNEDLVSMKTQETEEEECQALEL